MTHKPEMIKEAVGVFNDADDLQEAVRSLEASGFERRHISVAGSESSMKKVFGRKHVRPEALEDNPNAPRAANISPEEIGVAQGVLIGGGMLSGVAAAIILADGITIAGGMLTAVALGGLVGASIGAFMAKILGDKYTEFFEKQIEKGGAVLWVNVEDKLHERKAKNILLSYGAEDVHIHKIDAKLAA